jgi:hypothetical protein
MGMLLGVGGKSEKGHDGVGLIGATALDGGDAHGRAHGEAGTGDRAAGVGLAFAGLGKVRASSRKFRVLKSVQLED